MNEWNVVGVIAVLVGLIAAVTKPVLDSTKAINSLNSTIVKLQTMIDDDRKSNEAAHKRMGDHIDRNSDEIRVNEKMIINHEGRIKALESERKG